jgi:hypothetical protein
LHWEVIDPVPQAVEKRVKARLLKRGEYGPLLQTDRTQLEDLIEDDRLKITCEQALSLRHLLLQEKMACRHRLLQRQRKVLLSKYIRGDSICSLATKFDFAPMAVARAILVERDQLTAKQLKDLLKDPQQNRLLSARDVTQIVEASQNDIIVSINQEQSLAQSEMFEDFLCSYLTRHNIKFVRQKDIAAQQMEKLGKLIATPDILLVEPIFINGHWTNWMDAKNYYGADMPFLRARCAKQIEKYAQRWGPGSLVFSKGHCSSLSVDGCSLLGVPVVGPIIVALPALHPGSAEGCTSISPTNQSTSTQAQEGTLTVQGQGLLGRVICIRWPLEDGTWKWCTGKIEVIKKSNACRRGSWYKYGVRFLDDADQEKLMWTRLHHLQFEIIDSRPDGGEGKENSRGSLVAAPSKSRKRRRPEHSTRSSF